MKKIGFAAIRRIGGAVFPGADVAMDVAAAALSRDQDDEGERLAPFQNRDADQHGAGRYGIAQSRDNDEVVECQFLLAKSGYLKFSDIDGCIGPGTLRAIETWEAAEGVNFYTGDPLEEDTSESGSSDSGDLVMLSPRVSHTSQGAPGVADIEIPGLAPDKKTPLNRPVARIGCASCSMVSVWDFYSDSDIAFPPGLNDFISRGCYTDERDIIWDRAVAVISEECAQPLAQSEVSRAAAINYIRDNMPVLCHAGRGHWVTAVGYSDELGFVYNDPATSIGNGYDDPERNSEKKGVKGYSFSRFIAIYPV